jgi:hypothetical protein
MHQDRMFPYADYTHVDPKVQEEYRKVFFHIPTAPDRIPSSPQPYQRYPMGMYKNEPDEQAGTYYTCLDVRNAAEEAAALADGWELEFPKPPAPVKKAARK